MGAGRRKFTKEFKEEAAPLATGTTGLRSEGLRGQRPAQDRREPGCRTGAEGGRQALEIELALVSRAGFYRWTDAVPAPGRYRGP